MQHWYRHWHFEEPGHEPSLACNNCFHARVGLLVAAEDSCSNRLCVCTECGASAALGSRLPRRRAVAPAFELDQSFFVFLVHLEVMELLRRVLRQLAEGAHIS